MRILAIALVASLSVPALAEHAISAMIKNHTVCRDAVFTTPWPQHEDWTSPDIKVPPETEGSFEVTVTRTECYEQDIGRGGRLIDIPATKQVFWTSSL